MKTCAIWEFCTSFLAEGEPLLHSDFFTLGAKARELGFVIRIKSNGHDLDEDTALKIKSEIDPFMIDISLHGASAAVHDRQTQVAGSFDRLQENLESLVNLKQGFRLNATLTAWNEHEIKEMFDLAHSYDVPLNMSMTISGRDDGSREPLTIIPSEPGMLSAFQLLRKQAGQMGNDEEVHHTLLDCDQESDSEQKLCGSASSTLTIDPFGNVLPCVQWRETAGSLHEESVRGIWKSSELLQQVRSVLLRKNFSKQEGAGHCPALAKILTGNPLQVYPQAVTLKKAIEKSEDNT